LLALSAGLRLIWFEPGQESGLHTEIEGDVLKNCGTGFGDTDSRNKLKKHVHVILLKLARPPSETRHPRTLEKKSELRN
jgi:hypothetical protein